MEKMHDTNRYCLKDLLDKVENDERILRFRFQYKDLLVWPFIRAAVYGSIVNRMFHVAPIKTVITEKWKRKGKIVKRLIQCLRLSVKTPLTWKKKECLFIYSSKANVINAEGKVYNRVYGKFVDEISERSGIIETVNKYIYDKSSHVDKRYLDPINLLIHFLCLVCKPYKDDVRMADALMNYLCSDCMLDLSSDEVLQIKKRIINISLSIRFMDRIFPGMFRKIEPKVVFLETGSYGGRNAYYNKLMHEMGIKTVEVQHGWISVNHWAYVHSKYLCSNIEYASYMPDYYLGYSEYWLDKINIPGQKIPIGNPWFWEQYASFLKEQRLSERAADDHKTILWIALVNHQKNLELLDDFVRESNNEYYIRMRLYPGHKYLERDYTKYEDNKMIIMDDSSTVYDAFKVSDYVIAEASTVIYEALAVGKPTYVYESDRSVFFETMGVAPSFKNAKELLSLLQKEDIQCDPNNPDMFFGAAWREKFRDFIEVLL